MFVKYIGDVKTIKCDTENEFLKYFNKRNTEGYENYKLSLEFNTNSISYIVNELISINITFKNKGYNYPYTKISYTYKIDECDYYYYTKVSYAYKANKSNYPGSKMSYYNSKNNIINDDFLLEYINDLFHNNEDYNDSFKNKQIDILKKAIDSNMLSENLLNTDDIIKFKLKYKL